MKVMIAKISTDDMIHGFNLELGTGDKISF